MRDWKMVWVGGALMVLAGCREASTAPLVKQEGVAKLTGCEYDASRSGYFVRSGNKWTDEPCTP